ncbi:Protein CBG09579 [Caenorhabditis briggsae]|uniref:Protein CBG09579 n=1 Tax=Caenorhabditis briggsae TaxID=6238 RepID=A8X8R8_CAEBR|nr:Protein CBG09579 [Caenorhabditis briggsae]CAP29029.1 Protein CBG09579 [Caenorhabditis briggsae]
MTSLFDALSRTNDRLPSPNILPEDFLELLKSNDFDTKLTTLIRAATVAKREEDWFQKFKKKGELFKCIDKIVCDDRWELQHQCIKFLVEAMPTFGSATEYCMCYVMPNLIPKLVSNKVTVRKITHQAISTFLRLKPEALQSVLKMVANFMPNCTSKPILITELHAILIPEVVKGNWASLVENLATTANIQGCEEQAGILMKKFHYFIGNESWQKIVSNLIPEKREVLERITENVKVEQTDSKTGNGVLRTSAKPQSGGERRLRYGIIPSLVCALIAEDSDANQKIAGLEKMKQVVDQITAEEIARLVPHLHSYLLMLSNVLEDLNFKVVVLALDIVRATAHHLKGHMEAHIQQFVNIVAKHFGNQKSVIKQIIMMTFMELFQNINPKTVGGCLRVYLENKNSRVREEVINIYTASLMTISPSKFNLPPLVNIIVPMFHDPKKRVRLAAFEQLSVLAYLLNGKTEIIMKAVRDFEQDQKTRGLAEAVTARIRRQVLPRIRYDGLIEYSTPPMMDSFDLAESEMSLPSNADLAWIVTTSNPNSSTSSWEAPKRPPISPPEKSSFSAPKKEKEVNNNHIDKKGNLKKMRSDTNLSEDHQTDEMENDPPRNFDDRPAKASGAYSFQDFDSPISPANMGKKSVSHHSLPITSHPPLKHAVSQPQKRVNNNGTFLRSGQGQRTKSVSKPHREPSAISKTYSSLDSSNMSVNIALKKMAHDEWSEKVDGLNMISTLSETQPKQVSDNLKEVIIAILNECKNLRSSVSRVAIVTIGTVAQNLNSKIDSEMEKICVVLLNKAGDVSNAFIRDDATDSLNKLVKAATAGKALQGIIVAGSKSKNNTIRASCANFVHDIITIQGSSVILNNQAALCSVLPVLIQFAKDQSPQVRTSGKQSLCFLSKDPNFDRLMKKNANESDIKTVKDVLANVEKRGGVDSLESTANLSGSLSRIGSTRRVQKKLPDSLQLDLDEIRTDLLASGWERRLAGLQRFEEMCGHAAKAVASDTRLIEAFISRLGDTNSKVASYAMETYISTMGSMAKLYSTEANLKAVLNQVAFALTAHLSSKSEEHKHLARTCIQQTIRTIEPVSLLPAMTAATKKSNIKQRPYITTQYCELCKLAYKNKPKQVEVMALPLLWDSIKNGPPDVDNKKASQLLAKTLAKLVGEKQLLDLATAELDPNRKKQLDALIR